MELRDLSAREEAFYDEPAFISSRQDVGEDGQTAHPAIANAVFLHTSWRSGGTWIWSRCRDSSRVCGFYEPLHEQAARFRRRDVSVMRPASWQSNHSDTAPYFEEYRPLIGARGRGVAGYRPRFAFDAFFRDPGEPADGELGTYLEGLLTSPNARGKLPVLKFCRSLGRVGWLERHFPRALHMVVLRDPLAQFNSIHRLLEQQRNRYFALAPLLVLARNAGHPSVRMAATTLGVRLPDLHSADHAYGVETCWRHIRRAPADERYRAFLGFWTLCAISALDSEAEVIDIDAIGANPAHRNAIETALRAPIGETVKLLPRTPPLAAGDARQPPPGMREAHEAARALLDAHAHRLSHDRLGLIAAKLASPDVASPGVRGWQCPPLPPAPARPRRRSQRLLTAILVCLARAIQPVRRLHGAIAWRRMKLTPSLTR